MLHGFCINIILVAMHADTFVPDLRSIGIAIYPWPLQIVLFINNLIPRIYKYVVSHEEIKHCVIDIKLIEAKHLDKIKEAHTSYGEHTLVMYEFWFTAKCFAMSCADSRMWWNSSALHDFAIYWSFSEKKKNAPDAPPSVSRSFAVCWNDLRSP